MRTKYPKSEEVDSIIRACYGDAVLRNHKAVRVAQLRIQSKTGVLWPGTSICQRAAQLGVSTPRKKQLPPWTDVEERLLERHAHRTPQAIAKRFSAAGFSRSVNEIAVHRRATGLRRTLEVYCLSTLAPIFGVERATVRSWIRFGWLAAPCVENGYYEIQRKSVRQFLLNHYDVVDLGKVEKSFLVDLLSGGKARESFRKEAA